MPRPALWTAIAETLTREIGDGCYAPGAQLPTEAALAARFGVNRHTVRRALKDLSDKGLTLARRGAGVFVAASPTLYPVGPRTRFHQTLQAAGRIPGRRILMSETRQADAQEARALQIAPGAPVHAFESLALADGQPIALSRGVFPAERLPGILEALHRHQSVTRALAECGIPDYIRRATQVSALTAGPAEARHLHLAEGAPILRTTGVNVDPDGRPVEYGITRFAGDRVTVTFGDALP